MTDISANLASVEARIAAACERAGRPRDAVRLLPVSKTRPAADVRVAYESGYRRFGENRVQEAANKAAELASAADLTWAVIGHLQTNKAKQLVGFASEFQALHSVKVAAELEKRLDAADRELDVLIEVNTSGEESKFGVAPAGAADLASELRRFARLRVRGLMTIAANTQDQERVGACFDEMRRLREQLRQDDRLDDSYDELSMGMTNDFELAIERGSTCVRLGTAIFGARDPLTTLRG